MKLYRSFFVFLFLIATSCFSQDTLYMKDKTKQIVFIKSVDFFGINCINNDSSKLVVKVVSRFKVDFISYKNGNFVVVKANKNYVPTNLNSFNKGELDAKVNYKGKSGAIFTGISTFLTGGIGGLVPAIACSATKPKFSNLSIPNNAPIKDRDYIMGYYVQAKSIKQRKVWTGYFIGFGCAVIAGYVFYNNR